MIAPGKSILLVAALAATTAFASATVTQTVSPEEFGNEDVAQVTVEVTDARGAASVNLEPGDDFEILGRSSSTSTRVEMSGNGEPTVQRSQIFTFNVRAKRTGDLEIPAAKVVVDGQQVAGSAARVQVSEGHVASARPPRSPFGSLFGGSSPFGSDPFGDSDPFEDAFDALLNRRPQALDAQLIASVDDKTVYKGEQATVSVYLATRSDLTSVGNFKLPTIDGASSQDLELGKKLTSRPMTVDGKEYQAFLIARRALFPNRAGALRIPSASIEVHGRTLKSDPTTIRVNELPPGGEPGEPVGTWRISATAKGQPKVGEPLPVSVVVEGTGDLQSIPEPKLEAPGARVLAPSVKDTPSIDRGQLGGTRAFEFLVMPEEPGALTIPPVTMAVFDPKTGRHDRVSTEPLALTVAAAPQLAPPQPPSTASQPPPVSAASPNLRALGLVLASVAGLIAAFVLLRPRVARWARARADRPPTRGALRRQAVAALADARSATRAGRDTEAISQAERALFDCARALGLSPGRLDLDQLAQDASNPFLSSWALALLECRRARFSRLDPTMTERILDRVASVLEAAPRKHRPSPTLVPAAIARSS